MEEVENLDLIETPMFGVLTQPMHQHQPSRLVKEKTEYVLQEHVKFLEAAGARVVPVSFLLPEKELAALLSKLNGLYIPGDNKNVLDNEDYGIAVKQILKYATE
jgi:gamma-glutamyl-gamma-aminobutyrate hydrolase PuuD